MAEVMPLGAGGMQAPPMPSPDQIERAKAILDAVSWEDIEPILRTDERRSYNIDIETDSTVFEDGETEKAQRIECVTAVVSMLEKGVPAIQMNPKLAPLMKELGMFTLGAFKIGRTLEETFEETFDQLGNIEPQPNPEQQKMEMEAKAKQEEFALKAKEREQDLQFKESEYALKQRELEEQLNLKREEMGLKREEMEMKREENAFTRQLQQQQRVEDAQFRQEEMAFKREDSQLNRQAAQEDRQFKRQESEANFALKHNESTARLAMDQDEQRARRAMEADDVKGAGGMTARQEIETGVAQQIGQVAQSIAALQENQLQVVEAIQGLFAKQEQTQDALLTAIKRIGAPRNIKRDPKTGRAIGVEILEEAMA